MKGRYSFLFVLLMSFMSEAAGIVPHQLRCEQMVNPLTIDEPHPHLSWINMPSSEWTTGERQTAYRICVASSKEKLLSGNADVWDSGRVVSEQSYLIPYEGKSLASGGTYWWQVKVWNKDGKESSWSEPACWGMGLLDASEWQAKWIGADFERGVAPLFRRTLNITKPIRGAKMYVSALGYFEVAINGSKVGDDFFVPNISNANERPQLRSAFIAIPGDFTDYRVYYLAYDITELLQKGNNTVEALLGEGFYNAVSHWVAPFGNNAFLCQIEVIYSDGTKEIVATDDKWQVAESQIVLNGVYAGEIYDATRNVDSKAIRWQQASIMEPPTGKLSAQMSPSDRVAEVLNPVSFSPQPDGSYKVDFEKEISGWIRLKDISAEKGDTIHVHYICESPLGIHKYISRGKGKESYAPRFTWFVFRSAIIEGCELTSENVEAEAVYSDVPLVARFNTSHTLFNQIHAIWQQSEKDNLHGGIQSDCPHRERSPYLGDGQVVCPTVMETFDAAAFYRQWLQNVRDVQDKTGYVPNSAPWQPACGGGVAWGAAANIIPWEHYLHYGDVRVLEENYAAMKSQLQYMLTWLTEEGIMYSRLCNVGADTPNKWFNLGEWVAPFGLPAEELVHTFYLWYCASINASAASALGVNEDEAYYSRLANEVKEAFHKKFYNPVTKSYGDYGSNVFALYMGVPDEVRADVVNTLSYDLSVRRKGHLDTGIFGTRFLPEVLIENGLSELLFQIFNQTDFPSYGYMLSEGATALWEQWDGQNSHNHPMFGGGLTWFYRYLAGLRVDSNQPGYKHFVVAPIPFPVEHVYYSISTPYGIASSEINRKDGMQTYEITVPVGATATFFPPETDEKYELQQGRYRFSFVSSKEDMLSSPLAMKKESARMLKE